MEFITAEEYLSHFYKIENTRKDLPLADENYIEQWREYSGQNFFKFINERFLIETDKYKFREPAKIMLTFTKTMGGTLPVIFTANHEDFKKMEALINGRDTLRELPPTVNAFTISARNKKIYNHRIILLNDAPYSNISAENFGLNENEWLKNSYKLRLRHEAAHYETLRILGGMKNHALDEILADVLGQIAEFGNFSAARQRLFFGLNGDKCTGRLQFYCQKVLENERPLIYQAVDRVLDTVEEKISDALNKNFSEKDILYMLSGQSISKLKNECSV